MRNQKAPRLKMSILMQSAPSLSNDTAVDVDEISAEILKKLLCRALQKSKNAFKLIYAEQNKVDIETWLRCIFFLIPKKETD